MEFQVIKEESLALKTKQFPYRVCHLKCSISKFIATTLKHCLCWLKFGNGLIYIDVYVISEIFFKNVYWSSV